MARKPRKPKPIETKVVVDARQTIAPTRANYDERVARVSPDTAAMADYAIDRVHEIICGSAVSGTPLSDAFMKAMHVVDALQDVRYGVDVLVRKDVVA